MRQKLFLTLLILGFLFLRKSSSYAQPEPFGLAGRSVHTLTGFPREYAAGENYLFAGTDSGGVFLRDLTSPDSSWISIGLTGKRITAFHVYRWGVGPVILYTLLAGVWPDVAAGDSALLYKRNVIHAVTNWAPADTGLSVDSLSRISGIDGFYSTGHVPPAANFVGGPGGVYRAVSFPDEFNWTQVWPAAGSWAKINAVKAHREGFLFGTIWAGGETGFFQPVLIKSQDGGDTWETYYPSLGGDNACNSIAINPQNPNTVYAGMEGLVIKTTDGGQHWQTTALQNTAYYFTGIVMNPADTSHIVAGGFATPQGAGLFETVDGGANWTPIPLGGQITGVNAMVGDTMGGEFVVFIATKDNGVYRYHKPLFVDDNMPSEAPRRFRLYQNYPNPFNPTTTISWQLALGSEVELTIYNLLGQKIRTLVNSRKSAGTYQVQWDGRNSAGHQVVSGVYVYRLNAGNRFVQTRKMLLLR